MKILKQKNFHYILAARLVSSLGTTMQSFVLALYVLNITGSATKFASILFVAYLPAIVLAPVAGVYVDKMDKKKLLIKLDMIAGTIVGIYSVLFLVNNGLSLILIYVLVIALAIVNALYLPAVFSIVPMTIEKEDLVTANSVMSFVLDATRLLSPAIAGALYGLLGVSVVLIANATSFFVSAIFASCLKIKKSKTSITKKASNDEKKTGFIHEFKEGFLFIKNKPIFVYIVVLPMFLNLTVNGVAEIGVPYILKHVLLATDAEYGVLQSVAIASTLTAPILFAFLCKKKEIFTVLYYVVVGMAVVLVISIGLVSSAFIGICPTKYIPYITTMGIASALYLTQTVGSLCLFTIFQRETPENLMGRVGTILNSCATFTTPIGIMIYGFMFDHISQAACVAITAGLVGIFMIYSRKVLTSAASKQTGLSGGQSA